METLGSLCDKLSIIKLKQYHTEDPFKQISLTDQEIMLVEEINTYIKNPPKMLVVPANKIYSGMEDCTLQGTIGNLIKELSSINCDLWHEQEKVYDFINVPDCEKNGVIQCIAMLNIQRNQCIEGIDKEFEKICIQK